MAKKAALLTAVATTMVITAVGCGHAGREGTGTNDGMRTRMLTHHSRPLNYGTGSNWDMRLGLDRHRGTNPDRIRDADDMRLGLNRDNGITGYDQDGVNNWRDYKAAGHGHVNNKLEENHDLAQQLTTIDPVETAHVMLTDHNVYVAVKLKNGQDVESVSTIKSQIADKVHSTRPEVKNVYVSSNPDLVSRFQQYGEHLRQGKPFSGIKDEFNASMHSMFPKPASY
ncbi:YhcN/YlaJ family sporulation lipoprotein [Paenibacillus koleovorans]|uniref:YhcN/YlaJ family sporulation lipoprotein n=1 Tax=Paenibacillus koleovorans TaxID=121608 RepID=UPI001FE89915|nr:YhcN/YlaJ family sporulation lipoprotein [Paenibacillus koleovorans]